MPVNGLQGNPSITRSYWHELLWPQTGSCFLATHPNFLILIKIIHFLKSLFTAGRWKVIYPCWWNSPPWKKALVGVKWNSKTSPPHKGALFVRCINLSLLSNHLWSTQSGSLPVASSSEVCEGWMWIPGEPTPWASCQDWMSSKRESTFVMPAPRLWWPVFKADSTGQSWPSFPWSIDSPSHWVALGSHNTMRELLSGWHWPSRSGGRDLKTYTIRVPKIPWLPTLCVSWNDLRRKTNTASVIFLTNKTFLWNTIRRKHQANLNWGTFYKISLNCQGHERQTEE